MIRRLLFVPLLAALPALLCAQEKLVNCRTLEDAGNFVGPDEVIVNDMVCQKAKAGAKVNAFMQPAKPIPGAVISGENTNVVEAARVATKRVEAAREAIKEKAAQTAAQDADIPSPSTTPEPAAQPQEIATQPVAAPQSAETSVSQPTVEKGEPNLPANAVTAVPPPQTAVVPTEPAPQASPAPAAATTEQPAPVTNVVTPPAPTTAQAPAAAPAATESAKPEQIQDPRARDAVGSFVDTVSQATGSREQDAAQAPKSDASANPASAEPPAERKPEPTQLVVEPAPAETPAKPAVPELPVNEQPAPANEPAAPAPAAQPQPEANAQPATATASGFYDANAGANVVTVPHNEEKVAPGPSAEELAAQKLAAEEAAASLVAPDPNLPRERVVATGGFVPPKEEGLDPALEAHKTTFQPGDSEGFEEGHRPECTKNITLAGLKEKKLVLGTPAWAAKWIEKNQKRMPDVCFSDTPMTGARNYLIVFYTSPMGADSNAVGNDKIAADAASPGGVGGFTLSYGSTWHFAQERTVGTTVLTRDEADEPQSDVRNVWHATAYTESGVPVAEHWPEKLTKQIPANSKQPKSKKVKEAHAEVERVSDGLLNDMVGDIAKL